jgi:hypothetical protein
VVVVQSALVLNRCSQVRGKAVRGGGAEAWAGGATGLIKVTSPPGDAYGRKRFQFFMTHSEKPRAFDM